MEKVNFNYSSKRSTQNLFTGSIPTALPPLAERMRPRNLSEFVGQEHLVGENRLLNKIIETGEIPSLIFWGPPGSGKTTLAYLIAQSQKHRFVTFSAVLSGIQDIRTVIHEAKDHLRFHGIKTILFIDEIHRFNRAQQDAFLPHIESGTIILIGATTENPSFEIISPLLSRTQVVLLNPLTPQDLIKICQRALDDSERGLKRLNLKVDSNVLELIADLSQGDARRALNILETAALSAIEEKNGNPHITPAIIQEVFGHKLPVYDKDREEHYNLISAFIKSLRGSDPDAAIYYLARMLEGGEDPLFIARRLIIFAAEDIGNADPHALPLAVAAMQSFDFVGLPEGWIPLAQATTYLASAPKSNASYRAYLQAQNDIKKEGALPVPLELRNAPTQLMKNLGYGRGYEYPHNYEGGFVARHYLPEKLQGKIYYHPTEQGEEKEIKQRLQYWRAKRSEKNGREKNKHQQDRRSNPGKNSKNESPTSGTQ